MGNHSTHEKGFSSGGSGASTPRGSTRGARSGSSGELQGHQERTESQTTSLVPVEKLGKLLSQRSQKEDGINGVTEKCFTKYLFPMYPELARNFFNYIHRNGKCKNKHIPVSTFRQQCERILAMLDDSIIIDTYVRMFSSDPEEAAVGPDDLRSLLFISYKLSMDHYPEGPQTCLMINKTLTAVVRGCFNKKESHSVGFVVRWLEENCHRLIFPVHRYCVHMLATRHRDIEARAAEGGDAGDGLELGTPVLERSAWAGSGALLPMSAAWLLAATAPPLYSRPLKPPTQPHPGGTSASAAWLARLVCTLPSHWAPLYASREHGLGANRFLHHTLAYRGPTLIVVEGAATGSEGDEGVAEGVTLVVASPQEWRDTHQYWGGPDCALIQLLPTFALVEQAPKMLYLNSCIRGYPKGLRAGSDPRKPLLAINEGFDSFTFKGVPYPLSAIEVWGCGEQSLREAQLEVKKWQVKEAERQRSVSRLTCSLSQVWGCGEQSLREAQLEVKKWQVKEAERQRSVSRLTCSLSQVWGCGEQSLREAQLEVKKWQVKEAERQRSVSRLTCSLSQVWGCGEQSLREAQLEVKKWQVKEAERQRSVSRLTCSLSQVWGCGEQSLREAQLEVKKWQVKEAERQRSVSRLTCSLSQVWGCGEQSLREAQLEVKKWQVKEAERQRSVSRLTCSLSQVWGCGEQSLREAQLEVKKWQVKEAERQRSVSRLTCSLSQVWGCGEQSLREAQLEVKKWQVKEAERQRSVSRLTCSLSQVWGCGEQSLREAQLEVKKWQVKEAERQRSVSRLTCSLSQVWGCGEQSLREAQLEVKKWQVKEAERQRSVSRLTCSLSQVWGCGEQSLREAQLEVKKWQVKEAERQRSVKISAADWIEHPDRYLLELAGRPQYNNSSK